MPNESTDANQHGPPEEDPSDPDGTGETRADDETERLIEQEVLNAVGDDESLATRAVAELEAAVDDEETAAAAQSRISTDTLFELLSDPGNRFVLTYLLRADNPTTYADLVEYVVERAETPSDTTEAKFRGRVAARLVHGTLPTLADAGLIEHDSETQTVTATPAIEAAAPHLALAMSQSVFGEDTE